MYRASEFEDWHGRDWADSLRLYDGAIWYPKGDGRPERLAYLLAGGELNVAEVRPAPVPWKLGENAVIVRIAQQYDPEDLPIKELDEAVAAELVFSLWIRRRDTHAFNRVYVEGVPIFFDHHVAFGVDETQDCALPGFLRDGDAGHVPRWRVRLASGDAPPTTLAMRRLNRNTDTAVHTVDSIGGFMSCLGAWTDRLVGRDLSAVESVVAAAGFAGDEVVRISELLRRSQHELPALVEQVATFVIELVAVESNQLSAVGES